MTAPPDRWMPELNWHDDKLGVVMRQNEHGGFVLLSDHTAAIAAAEARGREQGLREDAMTEEPNVTLTAGQWEVLKAHERTRTNSIVAMHEAQARHAQESADFLREQRLNMLTEKRDFFAAHAMRKCFEGRAVADWERAADECFDIGEAMMKAREKRQPRE